LFIFYKGVVIVLDIIDNIFRLIKQNNTTASAVSKATGIKQATISQWKKKLQQPSIANIKLLAVYFNVSTDYLLGNEQKESLPSEKDKLIAEIIIKLSALPKEKQETILLLINQMQEN